MGQGYSKMEGRSGLPHQDVTYLYKRIKTEEDIEEAIRILLGLMHQREKVGQLQQISYGDQEIDQEMRLAILNGDVGSVLNNVNVGTLNEMQRLSMKESRLKIPLLMGRDVIHGFKTMFPIPLGQAASFNPDLVEKCARAAAVEASSCGIRWTFSPMVDIARDARWGRIAQGCGEDPYLASRMGVAMVRGYQTANLKDMTAIAACGKHYVGYGASEGGRDYNTTLIPENTLRDIYLTPFKALAEADCQSYMSAFNDLNGQPSSGNQFTLKQVLRSEWNFKGIVVSDYTAISEMIVHGFCENEKDAALKGFNGGVDMEMVSDCYLKNLSTLISEGKVTQKDLDTAVSNVLRVKLRLGLFENWYTDPARQKIILNKEFLQLSKQLAIKSSVLLQNKFKVLPLSNGIKNLAVIGCLANDGTNQIGCWAPDGEGKDCVTPLTSLKQLLKSTNIMYAKGIQTCTSTDKSLFKQAIDVCSKAERIIMFLGEDNDLSGQSNCRAFINLPGVQLELLTQIAKLKIPIVLVVYAGRPLVLADVIDKVDALAYCWHLGTMAGPAIVDLLFGLANFSGRLPVSFPKSQGQIPLYYNKKNTGRPDIQGYIDNDPLPLFPFGFGLSYSDIEVSLVSQSRASIGLKDELVISVQVNNKSQEFRNEQPLLLYIRDLVGSYTRPVMQLKDFQLLDLEPGQSGIYQFRITEKDLRFWTRKNVWKAEPGKFHFWVGGSATGNPMGTFSYTQDEFQMI